MKFFLYGPSGSGKTTVGKIIAVNLDLPFVDLDEEIEARPGVPIPEIFASHGESRFREIEKDALETVCRTRKEEVVALGGGALLDPSSRAIAQAHGRVLCLVADPDTLLERLSQDSIERPLLKGDPKSNIAAYLAPRTSHYKSFDLQLSTSDLLPDEIARSAQILLGTFRVKNMAKYDVRVKKGALASLGDALKNRELRGPIALVTDENVGRHHASSAADSLTRAGFTVTTITIPPGEAHKTLESVQYMWDRFLDAGLERASTVVALGGGVIGDLAGFAAATYLRGIPWVAVPTTLLAMVDASLGGKTGADLPQGKNLVGAFHAPRLVWVDPNVLSTLPARDLRAGLGEVVKHGVIADPDLFEILAAKGNKSSQNEESLVEFVSSLVARALAVKIDVIEVDPYEKGVRMALNLGHTVGHGVELASGFELLHGEAIAIGTVAEARLAERIGLAETGLANKIIQCFSGLGLPTEIPADLDRDEIIRAMTRDKKKANGKVRFALPVRIGEVKVGVEIDALSTALES